MSNLDTYRAWEKSHCVTQMLLFTIERDDGSAAKRLTITNKPYYDTGAGGAKYHDTYPAPIACVINDSFIISEQLDGTTVSALTIIDESGTLTPILAQHNMMSHQITGYFGDQHWSMMETELPNRFEMIFRGEIDRVEPNSDGTTTVRIKVLVRGLRNKLCTDGRPFAIGHCFNVPLKLVSSSALEYAFNSVETFSTSSDFTVYDNRVALTGGGTDYTNTLEGGLFKGLVTMASPPAGLLTADIAKNTGASGEVLYPRQIVPAAISFIREVIVPDYEVLNGTTLSTGAVPSSFFISESGAKGFVYDGSTIKRYSITSENFNAASYDGASYDKAISAVAVTLADDRYLYWVTTAEELKSATLGTPLDPSTAGATLTKDVSGVLTTETCIRSRSDGTMVYVSENDAIRSWSIPTPGDVTGAVLGLSFRPFSKTPGYLGPGTGPTIRSFDFNASGTRLAIAYDDKIEEYELPAAYDLTNAFKARRSYYSRKHRPIREVCYSASGDKMYIHFDGDSTLSQLNFTDGFLPFDLFTINTDVDTITGGVFYDAEVEAGTVLRDLLTGVFAQYTVDALGTFRAVVLGDSPDAGDTPDTEYFTIEQGDCIGERGDHIRLVETSPKYGTYYGFGKRNYRVMSDNEIGGAVSNSERESVQREYTTVSETGLATDYDNPELISVYTSLCPTVTTTEFAPFKSIVNTERVKFALTVDIATFSRLSNFALGMFCKINLENPFFETGAGAMVIGIERDYIQRTMSITFDRQV